MLNTISPTAPVVPWLGGNHNLPKRICRVIDATLGVTYAGPFMSMDGTLKDLRSPVLPR